MRETPQESLTRSNGASRAESSVGGDDETCPIYAEERGVVRGRPQAKRLGLRKIPGREPGEFHPRRRREDRYNGYWELSQRNWRDPRC